MIISKLTLVVLIVGKIKNSETPIILFCWFTVESMKIIGFLSLIFASHCMGFTAYDLWKMENKIDSNIQEAEAKRLIERILGYNSSNFIIFPTKSFRQRQSFRNRCDSGWKL